MAYNATETEKKWQDRWENNQAHQADFDDSKPKYYNLVMFPYPSGDKLHIGHWYNYAPADSWGRYMRMKGYNVFEPIGFDSFGLPAENYAIKTGVHPSKSITQNTQTMQQQLGRIGVMYDWSKTLKTSDPEYYKWTQWLFLKMYENKLAYKQEALVNWCSHCQTVLANEQVQDGTCERCDTPVVQKALAQWFWKITDYAQRLLDGLDTLDWPEKTKLMQKNWIGRSEGVYVQSKIEGFDEEFEVWDSVPQTFRAQTFTVIAPEHPLIPELVKGTEHEKEVLAFVEKIRKEKSSRGFDEDKDPEGIFTGRYMKDPFGTGDLPLWIASFALMDYGSGIVHCSAHDERDFAFAKKYNIPLHPVMFPADPTEAEKVRNLEYCYFKEPEGILAEPDEFKGRKWGEARSDIIAYLEEKGIAKSGINYRLRDWLVSRQRYWGSPIPIVYDPEGNAHPIPEEHLPWKLPTDVEFKPEGTSPLADSQELIERTENIFGKGWRPEVDTMDTFVCSSFYYLRYLADGSNETFVGKDIENSWMPIDMYIGGPEHACMHLIYARFVMMALKDFGIVSHEEPFKRLIHQGLITKDGAKMSKSKGNVVSPDSFVEKYGSDVFRMYLMFMGPFTEGGDWNDQGITGISRFVEKFYTFVISESEVKDEEASTRALHQTIKKISIDIEKMQFNTVISAMMEFLNGVQKIGLSEDGKRMMVRLIAPLAPHLAEELWEKLGGKDSSIFDESWPEYNEALTVSDTVTLAIQVNGKVRGQVEVAAHVSEEEALEAAAAPENVQKYLEGKDVVKKIYVPGKLVSFVVKG